MFAQGHRPAISDRLLDRMLLGLVLVLVIGVPAFAAFYWFDRHPDNGPSLSDRAIAAAEEAVRAQPGDLAARNALAAAYVGARRYDDAITQFGEILKVAPNDRAALLGRGVAYRLSDRTDRALADFERLVQVAQDGEMAIVDPQLQQAYYEIGVIDLAQGRAVEAVTVLERALAINGADADALYAYASALIETGDPGNAVEALRRAVAFVPTGWCEPYYRMVDAYAALGEAAGAAYAGGMVAFCEGRLGEAADELRALDGGPYAVEAWLGLALIAAAQGDPQAAADFYQSVLAVEPENTSALIGLGQLGGAEAHAGLPTPVPGGAE